MHVLSLLASLLATSILTSASPSPFPFPGKDHHKEKCLSDHEARDILQRYKNTFETAAADEASVTATYTEDFVYESDSTSFFLMKEVSSTHSPL
jgi:hypothetical protein